MLGVTLFGIFLTPLFFYVIQRFTEWAWPASDALADELPPPVLNSH